ncbi:Hypothetical predicted protein [Paramuricea clavata]|uniref:Uncharacterized protein n=1 Tax=Paramuricea clavata TaxID=317549 RepID=A0A7D9F1M9_PARCT|nr:Hypothetical predicted protein [Paramuricea clavata]
MANKRNSEKDGDNILSKKGKHAKWTSCEQNLKEYSWTAIAFEQDFYIGRKWDGRYRWPTRKYEALVDKRFEMRASGKHFVLHQPTEIEDDLRKEFKEYYRKFFAEPEESNSADCKYVTTVSSLASVTDFCPVD